MDHAPPSKRPKPNDGPAVSQSSAPPPAFTVVVSGQSFALSAELQSKIMEKFPDSTLGAMLRNKDQLAIVDPFDGPVPSAFQAILDYAMTGELMVPNEMSLNLFRQEMDFWLIPYEIQKLGFADMARTLYWNAQHGNLTSTESSTRQVLRDSAGMNTNIYGLPQFWADMAWKYFTEMVLGRFIQKRIIEASFSGCQAYFLTFNIRKKTNPEGFRWFTALFRGRIETMKQSKLGGLVPKGVMWAETNGPASTANAQLAIRFNWSDATQQPSSQLLPESSSSSSSSSSSNSVVGEALSSAAPGPTAPVITFSDTFTGLIVREEELVFVPDQSSKEFPHLPMLKLAMLRKVFNVDW